MRESLQAKSDWLYIAPFGMYGCVNYIRQKYGNPAILITENGTGYSPASIFIILLSNSYLALSHIVTMSTGMDQPGNLTRDEYLNDATRVQFFRSYLNELKKGIDDGANVLGYFAWSLLDNFEWGSGYTSKFGIVYVDFNSSSLERAPKASAYWFRDLLQVKH
jgi:beta-glucosidase